MFKSKTLFASTLTALLCFVSAAPTKPGPDASPSIQVCTTAGTGCVTLPVVSDDCVNLTGGLSFLDQEITTATIPGGLICTFFQDFGCTATGVTNAGTDSEIVLQEGTWNFLSVPGLSGPTNFNDLTNSLTCSPL
ncbi:HET domain-containing protein [Mycena venus]|uniref:HET domain-containing protein n=1 Tax=Mycena venus TaxID=2733690 RepID=A0A8H6WSS2_9AGAR|nr:HET domain-containing protein [Mycena venus]